MRLPSSALARDLLWALLLTVVTQVEVLAAADRIDHQAAQHAAFLVATSAVALRRRAPLLAAVVCAAGMTAQTFAGPAPVAGGFLAMLVVLGSLGYHASLRAGVLGVLAVGVGALTYDVLTEDFSAGDFVANAAIVGMAWGLAHLVRRSTDARVAAELARDRAARDAAHAERGRIARDLHDSVAHVLTLITLQAGAARERTTQRVAADALASIETSGRQALLDVHRMLRLLDDDGQPGQAPGLQDLDDLLARVRSGGFDVDLTTTGDLDRLPGSVSATAYRVVAEGLTNAVKHSGSTRASVRVEHVDGRLQVEVTDEGGTEAGLPVGSGRGLEALRDRVAVFDGTLAAAPTGRGWSLAATIPVGRTA